MYTNSEFYVNLYLPWCLPLSSGGTFWENFMEGVVVHGGGGTNEQIMPKEGSFINVFSNNLNTVNFSATMLGYSLED